MMISCHDELWNFTSKVLRSFRGASCSPSTIAACWDGTSDGTWHFLRSKIDHFGTSPHVFRDFGLAEGEVSLFPYFYIGRKSAQSAGKSPVECSTSSPLWESWSSREDKYHPTLFWINPSKSSKLANINPGSITPGNSLGGARIIVNCYATGYPPINQLGV